MSDSMNLDSSDIASLGELGLENIQSELEKLSAEANNPVDKIFSTGDSLELDCSSTGVESQASLESVSLSRVTDISLDDSLVKSDLIGAIDYEKLSASSLFSEQKKMEPALKRKLECESLLEAKKKMVREEDSRRQEVSKPVTLSSVSKIMPSGVFVVATSSSNIVASQPLIHTNSLLASSKDQNKGSKVLMTGSEGSSHTGHTIRIVAPQGKLVGGGTAKAITLAQARQLGLFTQAKIGSLIPQVTTASVKGGLGQKMLLPPLRKTVTVMKPPKILPAPAPGSVPPIVNSSSVGPKKVLIRQANTLKPGTIISPTGGQVIRIPASQGITGGNITGSSNLVQLPAKSVQYVKLVNSTGGSKMTTTLVPVSAFSKALTPVGMTQGPILTAAPAVSTVSTIPSASFKVLPVSTSTSNQGGGNQNARVLIPTSTSVSGAVSTPAGSGSPVIMVPSRLIQMKKAPAAPLKEPAVSLSPGPQPGPPPCLPPPVVVKNEALEEIGSPKRPPSPVKKESPTAGVESGPSSNGLRLPHLESSSEEEDGPAPFVGGKDSKEALNSLEANGLRPRKPCNCTKSMCLKLYCDCFANGEFCHQCNCFCCYNNLDHEEERQKAIRSCLERNPTAFRPKIGKTYIGSDERRHNRGCNCRRSGCLKNYCECYEAKIPCSRNCKCVGCKNTESVIVGRRMVYDDDYRTKSRLYTPYSYRRDPESTRTAYGMMTAEVIQASCQCMVASVESWERENIKPLGKYSKDNMIEAERLIIQEFSRCLIQIIETVNKTAPAA